MADKGSQTDVSVLETHTVTVSLNEGLINISISESRFYQLMKWSPWVIRSLL